MNKSNARDLLLHGLKDMYDAEHQFAEALGTMTQQAKDRTLADGFRRHREVTRNQIRRLEECFEAMNERPSREHCSGAEGLVSEYQSFVRKERPDGETLDLFAAGSALKVEHYEIAAYAAMIDLALRLDMRQCATQLEKNMREEEACSAELEMATRKLGAELTGSSAGLRGAIETLRAGSHSGGVTAVGRAVASQATGALNRLEKRGRRARTASTRKRATGSKSTTRRKTLASRAGSRTTTARRKTTGRSTTTTGRRRTTTTGRRATTGTRRRTTATRPSSRARTSTRGPASRARTAARRPVSRAKTAARRTTRSTTRRATARRGTRARSSR